MAIVTGLPQGLFAYLIPILFQRRSKTRTSHTDSIQDPYNNTTENHLEVFTTKKTLKKIQTLE